MDLDMPGIDGFAATDQIITILNDKCLTSFICACTAYDGMDE
jgi:CheY-like chemotaxis protein